MRKNMPKPPKTHQNHQKTFALPWLFRRSYRHPQYCNYSTGCMLFSLIALGHLLPTLDISSIWAAWLLANMWRAAWLHRKHNHGGRSYLTFSTFVVLFCLFWVVCSSCCLRIFYFLINHTIHLRLFYWKDINQSIPTAKKKHTHIWISFGKLPANHSNHSINPLILD